MSARRKQDRHGRLRGQWAVVRYDGMYSTEIWGDPMLVLGWRDDAFFTKYGPVPLVVISFLHSSGTIIDNVTAGKKDFDAWLAVLSREPNAQIRVGRYKKPPTEKVGTLSLWYGEDCDGQP